MKNETILWADDEMDLLKPHLLFLLQKGYDVVTVTNGRDALEQVGNRHFDLIILDENMPGLSGLETLSRIKEKAPQTPVIMITKSEEEDIMNQAIGNKIADYLIKPVNPNQILLSIKKNLYRKEIISEQTATDYRQEFGRISELIGSTNSWEEWYDVYRKLVYWELELEESGENFKEMLLMQKDEANAAFVKFVKRNYEKWLTSEERPLMSHDLFSRRVLPLLDSGEKVFVVLIDNFRYDQWRVLMPLLADYFTFDEELYFSILPTSTQYARNAVFAGLMPDKIASMFPVLWSDEDEDESKNAHEEALIGTLLDRYRKHYSYSYTKILESAFGERVLRDFSRLENNDLNVCVINFIDMLSHARTDSKMIRELAGTDAAYRSLTESWFRHSPALDLFRRIAEKNYKVLLTTDHGTIHVDNPVKVISDRATNTNLRYKVGKNMTYDPRQVFEIKTPARFGLPSPNLSSTYIFATERDFFAYPNNYNHYVSYYKDTFQHGGISMEEMIIPLITLTRK